MRFVFNAIVVLAFFTSGCDGRDEDDDLGDAVVTGGSGGQSHSLDASDKVDSGGLTGDSGNTGYTAGSGGNADSGQSDSSSVSVDGGNSVLDAGDSEGSVPNAGNNCIPAWSSGFENGFPGEWLNYDNGSYSSDGTMPAGRVSAWTIIDTSSSEPIFNGDYGYKGWIVAAADDSHRAYPVIHTDIATPAVNTFMVYLDADYSQMGSSEWIHFGTWGNEDDQGNGTWALHTMSVRDSKLEFAHTDPFSGEYIGPQPHPDFPLRQWVRFTVYLLYENNQGFVQVWQDGVPMLRADVSALATYPGTKLTRAHWGMYASKETTQGIQYNDDIHIWTLNEPLNDLSKEPDCYLK